MGKLLVLAAIFCSGCTAAYQATSEHYYDWTDRYDGVGRLKEVRRQTLKMQEVSGLAWDPVNRGIWMINDGRRLKLAFLADPLGADMFNAEAHDLSTFELPKQRDSKWAEWPDLEAVSVQPEGHGVRLWVASELVRQAWRLDLENRRVDEIVGLPQPIGDEGSAIECAGRRTNASIEGLAVGGVPEGRIFFSANERCPAEIVRKEEKPDRLMRFSQTAFEQQVTRYMLTQRKTPAAETGPRTRNVLGERFLCPGVPRQDALNSGQLCKTGSVTDLAWQPEHNRLWVLLRHSRLVAALEWSTEPRLLGLWSYLGKFEERGSAVRFGSAEGLAIVPADPVHGRGAVLFIASDNGPHHDSELIGFELPEIAPWKPATMPTN